MKRSQLLETQLLGTQLLETQLLETQPLGFWRLETLGKSDLAEHCT